MTLGERILQKRKDCGLSQESLGEKLDVTRQTVYKWESDQAVPELDKLITLARIFDVGVGWLIAEEESDQQEQAYVEAAQRIAVLLTQSHTPQPISSEPMREAAKMPTSQKSNWFQYLLIAALVVILAAGTFKFESIDQKITNLENMNQCSSSASSHEENPTIEAATEVSGPGQEIQSTAVDAELTVYGVPSAEACPVGNVTPDETLEIVKTEKVNNQLWGYIQQQSSDGTGLTGWINLNEIELERNPTTAPDATK